MENTSVEASVETSAPVESAAHNDTETVSSSHEAAIPPSAVTPVSEATPDWFMKDKYKSVEEQAKSAYELQKKMGKYWGSPSESYSVPDGIGVAADDPLVANLMPALKEMGVSQDGFNHLVGQYMDANKNMMKGLEEDLKKTLTADDAQNYRMIEKWMQDNLTPEQSTQIKNNWLMSAEDFNLFNNIRLMAAPSTNVPSNNAHPIKFESTKEVEADKLKYRKELKAGLRVEDKNYENDLHRRFSDAASREHRSKGR